VAGRGIESGDTAQTTPVAVINEAMARKFFGAATPIGRRIDWLPSSMKEKVDPSALRTLEIVGVVADAKYNSLRQDARPMVFLSIDQSARTLRSAEIRSTLPASALMPPVRQALLQASSDIMIRRVVTLESQIDSTLAPDRIIAGLCGFFGSLALLLAAIGLYGVMAYGVTQRTSEIGIRMALGASRPAVLAMVLRQSLIVVLIGIAIGLPLAWIATRALGGFLYGLSPTDPLTITIAILTLLTAAGLAAYLPARRATRVDPMIALRYE